jgi:hypothetical protein
MNTDFFQTAFEQEIIDKIQDINTNDFALIRMTKTMLEKSIIDASLQIRNILEEANIVSYSEVEKGEKIMASAYILSDDGWKEEKCSYYRPETKDGDPRFWVYNLKKYLTVDTLLMFIVKERTLVAIPLITYANFYKHGTELFKKDEIDATVLSLVDKMKVLNKKVWIPSTNVGKPADKDVGVTLETTLNLPINSFKTPDFLGEIELKCKRTKSKTRNNLFAQVPNWQLSSLDSASKFLLKYGIPSKNHPGYKTLYVTVKSDPPNPQGFYFEIDLKKGFLLQKCLKPNGNIEHMCTWELSKMKERLYEKHPKTLWIEAEEKVINGLVHFKYHKARLTQKPIFGSFLNLIESSEISMDWTHRVLPNETKYNDHGFLFKIPSKSRPKLFNHSDEIVIV